MSTAYHRAAKLDTIWRLVCVCDGGRRSTDVDDSGARFEESEGLSGLVTGLWDDEHYAYEGICQNTVVGIISLQSRGRTRSGGLHGKVGRMRIRGFVGRDGGYDAKKLDIVVHERKRKQKRK